MVSLARALQFAVTGKALNSVPATRGWYPFVREPFSGAWQRNRELSRDDIMAFPAVFACTTLIAGDIAKLRVKLVELREGVWQETTNPAYSPVLRKPNAYQTRNQFIENWVLSRLMRGNSYVLKQRDGRGVVIALYVLDPNRVRPLVADDGEVYYELSCDYLAKIDSASFVVPASEIIHDRANCLYHPLVGLPPIFACASPAAHGLAIQNSSTRFFENGSQPGGILTAPGKIDQSDADRLKVGWEQNFSGDNVGRVAVLGDGLKYERLAMSAEESQLIEQLRWSAETVCSTFHIPPHMIGAGPVPALGNVEALLSQYYSQALQTIIEAMETCLDDGLNTGPALGVEFDLTGLLRMDTTAQVKALAEAVGGSIMKPNEARQVLDLPPVDGGDACYAQQQDFSLASLAERDRNKPFSTPTAPSDAPQADPSTKALLARVGRLLDEVEFAARGDG